ncbi:hypothetical protein, partial [Limnobacter sp.]|uniref:hypothetical protein n=1 Tax=Limnobacter sp. TaxID=2003368 RepID=UPI00311E48B9
MAYNNLSGTILQGTALLPKHDANGNVIVPIVSGNLSTSDGANIINVPRVYNATNNSLLTNVNGDANTITCETNLTFDGDTLNVVGDISASIGISASMYYGDGSNLTNISADNVAAQGPVHSIQFHDPTDNDFTGSANLLFQNNILLVNGGLTLSRRTTNTSVTLSTTDYYIGVDTTNSPVSLALPGAQTLNNGQTFVVKDEGGSANTNNVTIQASGSETIDGQNSVILESPFASIQLY